MDRLQQFKVHLRELNLAYETACKDFDLTPIGLDILTYLHEHEGSKQGPVTQKAIGEELCLPKQTVHTLIKNFLKRKLIELTPLKEDKRIKVLTLTDAGKELYSQVEYRIIDSEKNAFDRLTTEQQDALLESVELYNEMFKVCLLLTQ